MKIEWVGTRLYVDGKEVERPEAVSWRGLSVIAEIDPVFVAVSGVRRFHLSVAAQGRKPTDEEVQEAIDEWVPKGVPMHERSNVINPYVRHFYTEPL